MEWVSKLFDIDQLPAKVIAWVAILSGMVLFLPASALATLHLDAFSRDYGVWIGLAFIASSTLLTINMLLWLWRIFVRARSRRKWRLSVFEALLALDPSEMAVLREFFIQDRMTLRLPVDDPTVAGLRTKGILQVVGQLGENSLAGMLFPMAIASEARSILVPQTIGLPNGTPTEADRQRILNSRPTFMRRLADLDWLRNG